MPSLRPSLKWVGVLVAVSFFGCTRTRHHVSMFSETDTPLEHRQMEAIHNEAALNIPKTRRDYDVLRYKLKAEMLWQIQLDQRPRLKGQVTLQVKMPLNKDLLVLDSLVNVKSVLLLGVGPLPFAIRPKELEISLSKIPKRQRLELIEVQIEYEAVTSDTADGLFATVPRAIDAVEGHIVYTKSEPTSAPQWMPCNDDPRDRAEFHVQFKVAKSENFIANGVRTKNQLVKDSRVIAYETHLPLPTYLMAFAAGDLEITETTFQSIPIGVVARPNKRIDRKAMLDEIVRQMALFEKLLGPFPFEKYYVVFIPNYITMATEHASITFINSDAYADAKLETDVRLLAHELAHQWFGNWMSIHSWDDLGLKEGMATLLAEEALRKWENHRFPKSTPPFFGYEYAFASGDSIVDKELQADDKYTSGPYEKAAWLWSQIRSKIGEEKFWKITRQTLQRFAWKDIQIEEFVKAFEGEWTPDFTEKILTALTSKEVPTLEVKSTGDPGKVSLEWIEGEESILFPIQMHALLKNGSTQTITLTADTKNYEIDTQAIEFLMPGVNSPHPDLAFFAGSEEDTSWSGENMERFEDFIAPLFVPKTPRALAQWKGTSSHFQSTGLRQADKWNLKLKDWNTIYQSVSGAKARYYSWAPLCASWNQAPNKEKILWEKALRKTRPELIEYVPDISRSVLVACKELPWDRVFSDLLDPLKKDPAHSKTSLHELEFVAKLPLSTETGLEIFGQLAVSAPNPAFQVVGVKWLSHRLKKLTEQLEETEEEKLEEEQKTVSDFLLAVLEKTEVPKVVRDALAGIKVVAHKEFVPVLEKLTLKTQLDWHARKESYCALKKISSSAAKNLLKRMPASALKTAIVNGMKCDG